jgi:hypothetical protein
MAALGMNESHLIHHNFITFLGLMVNTISSGSGVRVDSGIHRHRYQRLGLSLDFQSTVPCEIVVERVKSD